MDKMKEIKREIRIYAKYADIFNARIWADKTPVSQVRALNAEYMECVERLAVLIVCVTNGDMDIVSAREIADKWRADIADLIAEPEAA